MIFNLKNCLDTQRGFGNQVVHARIDSVGGDALGVISHIPGGMLQLVTNKFKFWLLGFNTMELRKGEILYL